MLSSFCGCVLKTGGLCFADFNFWDLQHPLKIIPILFRENLTLGGTTRLSLDRSTVRGENLMPEAAKFPQMQGNKR